MYNFLQNIFPRPDLTGLRLGKNLQIRIVNYAKTLYIVNHVCYLQGLVLNVAVFSAQAKWGKMSQLLAYLFY